jgi:hypothetical protein
MKSIVILLMALFSEFKRGNAHKRKRSRIVTKLRSFMVLDENKKLECGELKKGF